MDLVIALLGLGAFVYFIERVRPLVIRMIDQREQRLPPKAPDPVQIPPDLVGLALMDSEEWAQREMLDGMRALYEEAGDWEMVRARYGVGQKKE